MIHQFAFYKIRPANAHFRAHHTVKMEVGPQWIFIWIPATMVLLYFLSWARGHGGRLPPGPKPLPIIGNLLEIGHLPHRSFAQLAKSYGPLMSIRLGQVTTIVVSSPAVAQEVLQKKDQSFSGRSLLDSVKALGHHEMSVILLPPGSQWRNLRRICSTQLFMSQKINDNKDLRRNKVRDLIAYVKERSLARESVDIGQVAFTAVMNSISNTFFSIDMGDIRGESAQNFKELVDAMMTENGKPNISDFFPVLARLDLQGTRRRVGHLIKRLGDIFDELIELRMKTKKKEEERDIVPATNDFLDSLLEYHNKNDDSRFDRRAMKSLLQDLFVAGTDTTSNTIEWAMAELLRNPSTMEKAQVELIQIIGNEREVNESDIQLLPYLQAVVKETLRLHPPAPFLVPHRAETTVELCGYIIPEGTRVLVNVWAIGRDEDVWPNAELFMPERFLGKDVDYKGQDFELIPFGAGRRICPGLPLAFLMIHLVLASLLLPFNWELPEGMESKDVDMEERLGFTLAMGTPLQAIPVLR